MTTFLMILLFVLAVFLILLVLVQRGRGGGLAGAFGGMGGQSAFGAKAGDTFTKITVGVATVWILLCVVTLKVVDRSENRLGGDLGTEAVPAEGANLRQGAEGAKPEDTGSGAEPSDTGQKANESEAPANGIGGDAKPASGDDTPAGP